MMKPRILLADDMAVFREPIAIALGDEGFDVITATDGEETLALMRQHHPDLLLLDISMPKMDGIECLKAIRQDPSFKNIPIIMLTAVAERDAVKDAASTGVQGYLLKSRFSLDEMLQKVRECLVAREDREHPANHDTRDQLCKHTKEEVLQRIRNDLELWSVPPVLHRVIALTRSSVSTFKEIEDAILMDQALAIRVMRVANSSFYSTGSPAESIGESCQRIGLLELRNIAMALLMVSHFDQAHEAGLVPQRFWEHSLTTGIVAQELARHVGYGRPEDAFLAGVLHDIGRMVLGSVFPKDYRVLLDQARHGGPALHALEAECFGLSQAEITRLVLEQWKMPQQICHAAWGHEAEMADPSDLGPTIVGFSNEIVHALAIGDSGSGLLMPFSHQLPRSKISNFQLQDIIKTCIRRAQNLLVFFSSQFEAELSGPLHAELAHVEGPQPHVTVLGTSETINPLPIFLQQLLWFNDESPNLAIMYQRAEEREQEIAKTQETIETQFNRKLPLLIVRENDGNRSQSSDDMPTTLALPCLYTTFVSAIKHAIQ